VLLKANTTSFQKATALDDHHDHQALFEKAPGRAPLLLTLDEYDPA
jgi:hypothetical protein